MPGDLMFSEFRGLQISSVGSIWPFVQNAFHASSLASWAASSGHYQDPNGPQKFKIFTLGPFLRNVFLWLGHKCLHMTGTEFSLNA